MTKLSIKVADVSVILVGLLITDRKDLEKMQFMQSVVGIGICESNLNRSILKSPAMQQVFSELI